MGRGLPRPQRLQRCQQRRTLTRNHHCALFKMRARRGQRMRNVCQRQLGTRLHVRRKTACLCRKRALALARQHKRQRFVTKCRRRYSTYFAPRRSSIRRINRRRLFQNDMRVGPADPKRRHSRPPQMPVARPGSSIARTAAPCPTTSQRAARPPPRAASSAEHSCSIASTILITPATPAAACVCPRFDLTEPEPQRTAPPRVLPVRRKQRLRLDRIAQASSPSRAPRPRRCPRHDSPHSPAPAGSPAAATDRSAPSDPWLRPSWLTAEPRTTASTAMAIAPRVGQALEHQHAAPFAPARAVRRAPRTPCSDHRATARAAG